MSDRREAKCHECGLHVELRAIVTKAHETKPPKSSWPLDEKRFRPKRKGTKHLHEKRRPRRSRRSRR